MSLMPSTRKQKSREKRSRQSEVMADMETMDVMLGGFSQHELKMEIEIR